MKYNFIYHAKDKDGKKKTGTIEAADQRNAIDKLEEQGLFVTTIEKVTVEEKKSEKTTIAEKRQVKIILLVAISVIISSGVAGFIAKRTIDEQKENNVKKLQILSKKYDGIIRERLKANVILEDNFEKDYLNLEYKEIQIILGTIENHISDIEHFGFTEAEGIIGGMSEVILKMKAAKAAEVCKTCILSLSDRIILFANVADQYKEFVAFEERFGPMSSILNGSINDLNEVISSSKNSGHQLTYTNLRDEIRKAKEIFGRLMTDIENRYKTAWGQRNKK